MGRLRKPTELLELTGAFKKDPARGRARANEPEVSEPLGEPPVNFTPNQRAAWQELQARAPWLKITDSWVAQLACRLKAKLDEGETSVGQLSISMQCLSRMGLTPTDISRVSIRRGKRKSNPFAEIAAEAASAKVQ